jgi:hypothetical protein
MRTGYRVDSETVRLKASDGSERVVLELSRTGLSPSRPGDPGFIIRSSSARAMRAGQGRSSSSSSAASGPAGPGAAEAAAGGLRRHRVKLSD